MKGLELARELYETVFRRVLAEEFPEYEKRIAVGLAGPGSECFGFDDEISRDHDFGPRLCLWIPDEDVWSVGGRLQARYRQLTDGLADISPQAEDRSGVIAVSAFYRRFTGCPGAPEEPLQWLRISDPYLATAVNGEVFRDELGEFTAVRETLLRGYPADVRRKKLAARLYAMGQAGQYNLPRSIAREDTVAVFLALNEFIRASLYAAYILNGRYAPFYKWLYRGAKELPRLRETVALVGALPGTRMKDMAERVEEICLAVLRELQLQGLTDSDSDFLVDQAFAVAAGIRDEQLAGLDITIG